MLGTGHVCKLIIWRPPILHLEFLHCDMKLACPPHLEQCLMHAQVFHMSQLRSRGGAGFETTQSKENREFLSERDLE